MGFGQYAAELNGKQVVEFQRGSQLADPATTVPALRVDWDADHRVADLLAEVLQDPNADRLTGLVVGQWVGEMADQSPAAVIELLLAGSPQLPLLTALFIGDVLQEENEVSWIEQTDMSPLWTAFPKLQYFRVRGTNGLSLGKLELNSLHTLIIEGGGLPGSVIQEVADSKLPSLEHLELYLGTDEYGWDAEVDDLAPILSGKLFPKLSYLGLRDAEAADEVAAAVAQAPILEQLKTLDMSLGAMTDEGGAALLESPAIAKLEKLDLHHHFMTDETVAKLKALPIEVDVSEQLEAEVYGDEVYRYIAVSE